jgi:hypothetical protein
MNVGISYHVKAKVNIWLKTNFAILKNFGTRWCPLDGAIFASATDDGDDDKEWR